VTVEPEVCGPVAYLALSFCVQEDSMRVKAVATELRVCVDTIKKLERAGAIPPAHRDHVGHRRYRPEDVEKIRRLIYGAPPARETVIVA
jgi:hypothetical protein